MSRIFDHVKPKTKGIKRQMTTKDLKIVRTRGSDGVFCSSMENAQQYSHENNILEPIICDFKTINEFGKYKESHIDDDLASVNETFKYECYRAIKLLKFSKFIDDLGTEHLLDYFEEKFGEEQVDFEEDFCKYISYPLDAFDSNFLFEHGIFKAVEKGIENVP